MERPWGRFSSLVILTVALMLALVACGGPVGPDDGGPPPPDPTTWRHLMIGSPSTLDPVLAYDTVSGRVLENVYETLYGFASSSTELSPRLATAHVVSPDGLTYTFTLREGVEFHSGNSFSCKDVEWSLEYGLVTAQPNGAVNYLIGRQLLGILSSRFLWKDISKD